MPDPEPQIAVLKLMKVDCEMERLLEDVAFIPEPAPRPWKELLRIIEKLEPMSRVPFVALKMIECRIVKLLELLIYAHSLQLEKRV